jgi:hypothetical protein
VLVGVVSLVQPLPCSSSIMARFLSTMASSWSQRIIACEHTLHVVISCFSLLRSTLTPIFMSESSRKEYDIRVDHLLDSFIRIRNVRCRGMYSSIRCNEASVEPGRLRIESGARLRSRRCKGHSPHLRSEVVIRGHPSTRELIST